MSDATEGEKLLVEYLNEFVRQTANLTSDVPQTSGVRPHPVIQSEETTLETKRFGLVIEQQPDEATPE